MAVNRSFSARPAPALIKLDCRRKVALEQLYMGPNTAEGGGILRAFSCWGTDCCSNETFLLQTSWIGLKFDP